MLIGVFLQSLHGIIIDRLWNPKRTTVPWYDKLHWYMGRGLFLVGLVNIPLGLVLMNDLGEDISTLIWVVLGVWYFALGLFFIALEYKKGYFHKLKNFPVTP